MIIIIIIIIIYIIKRGLKINHFHGSFQIHIIVPLIWINVIIYILNSNFIWFGEVLINKQINCANIDFHPNSWVFIVLYIVYGLKLVVKLIEIKPR